MKPLILRVTTGFSDNQAFSISMEEAHKAYYLFRNPEKRGVFENGIALIGKDIRTIQPDWHATMGWNPTHKLDDDDWNEINAKKKNEVQKSMEQAKRISYLIDEHPALMGQSLSEVVALLPDESAKTQNIIGELTKKLTQNQFSTPSFLRHLQLSYA